MGLLEDLTNDKSFGRRQSLYCTVCQLVDSLDEKERKLLVDRLDDKSIATAGIVRVLDKNGHSISSAVLSRHRRKECKRES
jgi:L-ribulose-5-phosphate 3-epimerase UlaE